MSESTSARVVRPHLLLLAEPSVEQRRRAARYLRDAGARVVAQYGTVAVEVLTTSEHAHAVRTDALFAAVLSGPMGAETLDRLDDEQRAVVEQWNVRFRDDYRRLRKERPRVGDSWGADDVDPAAPHTVVEPEALEQLLREHRRGAKGSGPEQHDADDGPTDRADRPDQVPPSDPKHPDGGLTGARFVEYEQRLRRHLDDATLAYHAARVAARLDPVWRDELLRIDPELLRRLFAEPECWEMTGEVSVGIVIVESSRDRGPRFGTAERGRVCQEVIDGLTFLAEQHPAGALSWVVDVQQVRVDLDDDDLGECEEDGPVSALEAGWRNPAMAQVSYRGNSYAASWPAVADYREDMRTTNRSSHALVVFVTPFRNCWHAYASSGRCVLAKRNGWGGWGESNIDRITAHEVAHLFGAADEYTGSGTPCSSCDSLHGCDEVPNGNCGACASPQQGCMMAGNHRRICGYTRGQIGWSHLFVELTTADVAWAGTDDWVEIDLGQHVFRLDTPGHDDRERGNREGYAVWAPGLRPEHVERVLVRKGPDGFAGGWRLQGVRVRVDGQVVCDNPSVDRWLEDDHRFWVGCTRGSDLVDSLRVRVRTADVAWAGTDDDVTLTMAGRSWSLDNDGHDDFERGHTDVFDLDPGTDLRLGDLRSVRIHKSSDGFAGGWKLGGVEVVANGTTVFSDWSVDRWLEDDHRTWTATV